MADLPKTPTAPGKLPPRSWRNEFSTEFTRFISGITRESIISNLKTLAWVIPLTLLIWIWAEREQQAIEPDVSVPFELTSAEPNRVVSLKPNTQDTNFVLDLFGPQARLQELRNKLGGGQMPQGLKLEIPSTYTPGRDYTLSTMDLVGNQRIFRDYGVTVQHVQPLRIEVSIDELVDRDAKIIVPPNLKNVVATFDPPTVKVRGPSAILEHAAQAPSLPQHGQLIVYASSDALSHAAPGHSKLTDIPVTPPDDLKDDRIIINDSHAKISANVDVSQTDKTYPFNSLTVTVDAPVDTYDKYNIIVPRPAVQNVTVTGRPDVIDAIQNGSIEPKPKARLVITAADLVPGTDTKSKVVEYDMPDGVKVSPEDAKKTVEFRVIDRASAATP